MTKRFWVVLVLSLIISGAICLTSCSRKQVVSEPALTAAEEAAEAERFAAEMEAMEAMEAQKALEEQRLREKRLRETRARREREAMVEEQVGVVERGRFLNELVHFDFDSSGLLPEAREILRRKARWLRANPDATVIVQGYCDERGTEEYNMALGDRRAWSVKTYLVDLGIAAGRLTTVSFGEEDPIDPGHNEAAWTMNRRAQFVIE
ncbi:MAG: peptidoglycan-associated lipoprotein [Desulfobacterales bacterium S5133MH4]|nr:MAG: peptidoglycan-associated lipoprotein [Desulfobacterales bacterium S5133MH4]